jgi:hypothetical protein
MTIRRIFSPAAIIATDGITGSRALELLRESRTSKLGSWEIEGANLYLVVKLPDTLTTAQLQAVMMATASLADDMEIKLSGARDVEQNSGLAKSLAASTDTYRHVHQSGVIMTIMRENTA